MPKKRLIGNIYGDLMAIEYIGNKKYKCKCIKCGALSEQYSGNLKGTIGCRACKNGYSIDLTGRHFGLLEVKEYNKQTKKWICECKCGKRTEVTYGNLKYGNTSSCGKCRYIEKARNDVVGGTRVSQIGNSVRKNNTSGITGVGLNRKKNKWYAQIRFRGKNYWLGYYDRKEDAAKARKEAEDNLHGDFLSWIKSEHPELSEKVICSLSREDI